MISQAFRPRGVCDHLSPEAVVLWFLNLIEGPFLANSDSSFIVPEHIVDHWALHGPIRFELVTSKF